VKKRFSEMSRKELKSARDELLRRVSPLIHATRVQSLSDNGVVIEGGTFPAIYKHSTGDLYVWGRGSRYSGGEMSVAQLQQVENEIKNFFNEYLGGE
jgi:hypothetical protein